MSRTTATKSVSELCAKLLPEVALTIRRHSQRSNRPDRPFVSAEYCQTIQRTTSEGLRIECMLRCTVVNWSCHVKLTS